jgi:hypothetical protein
MDVRTRDVPEQAVVTEQRTVDQQQLQEWLPGAMARVHAAAGDTAAGTAEQPHLLRADRPEQSVFVVIYEGNPNDGPTEVEVATPVRSGGTRTIPAHREAYVRVAKQTVQSGGLGEVYMAIEKWIGAEGLTITAAPRETYWTDFFDAAPDDEVLDVSFPVS